MNRTLALGAAMLSLTAGASIAVASSAASAQTTVSYRSTVQVEPSLRAASYRGRDTRGRCVVRLAGITSKFVTGSVVRLSASTGANLGQGKVARASAGRGSFAVLGHLKCGSTQLVRPTVLNGASGAGNAVSVVIPRRPRAGASMLGQTHMLGGGVIGPGGPYVPGMAPSSCPAGTFNAGQAFSVLDSASRLRVATGSLGGCDIVTTTSPACIPGMGCTPALAEPVYRLRPRNSLPTSVAGYIFQIGTQRYTLTKTEVISKGWNVILGDADQ